MPETLSLVCAAKIPSAVVDAAKKRIAALGGEQSHWASVSDVPAVGIPAVTSGRGTIKAGVRLWIIGATPRKVFLGEAANVSEMVVPEFAVITEHGSQHLLQYGRDFEFSAR